MADKGYIYTIVSLMLGLILLAVVSLHFESFRNTAELEPGKVRTDELHYFVESTKIDMSRAMEISGRRGAAYLVGYVITNHTKPLTDARAALAEMIVNASFTEDGETKTVLNMYNHSLNAWFRKIKEIGDKIGFDANTSVTSIYIYPYDAHTFLQIVTIKINISDKKGAREEFCRYYKEGITYYSLVSIEGVEDPLIALETGNRIRRNYVWGNISGATEVVDEGVHGQGVGGGMVLNLTADADPDINISSYDQNNSAIVPYTVFVIDVAAFDSVLNSTSKEILNRSGGVINLADTDLDSKGFPYVSGVPDLNLSGRPYVVLRNAEAHEIIYLDVMDDLVNKLYYATEEGPSFFDRLEGTENLSEKYLELSVIGRAKMQEPPELMQGLEGFVNVSGFADRKLYEYGLINEFTNQSSVDYEYFNETDGRWLIGSPYWFRLDGQHINQHNLSDYVYDEDALVVYRFDEAAGDIAYDSTRVPEQCTITNAVGAEGREEGGISFDGDADYVDCGVVPAINSISRQLSVSAWVNVSDDTDYLYISSKDTSFILRRDNAAEGAGFSFFVFLGGSWEPRALSGISPTPGEWYHVVGTYDADASQDNVRIYVNGELKGYSTRSGGIAETATPTFIGWNFNGVIDEVKIWNRTLSAEEVRDEYEMLNP